MIFMGKLYFVWLDNYLKVLNAYVFFLTTESHFVDILSLNWYFKALSAIKWCLNIIFRTSAEICQFLAGWKSNVFVILLWWLRLCLTTGRQVNDYGIRRSSALEIRSLLYPAWCSHGEYVCFNSDESFELYDFFFNSRMLSLSLEFLTIPRQGLPLLILLLTCWL